MQELDPIIPAYPSISLNSCSTLFLHTWFSHAHWVSAKHKIFAFQFRNVAKIPVTFSELLFPFNIFLFFLFILSLIFIFIKSPIFNPLTLLYIILNVPFLSFNSSPQKLSPSFTSSCIVSAVTGDPSSPAFSLVAIFGHSHLPKQYLYCRARVYVCWILLRYPYKYHFLVPVLLKTGLDYASFLDLMS